MNLPINHFKSALLCKFLSFLSWQQKTYPYFDIVANDVIGQRLAEQFFNSSF